MKKFINEFKEFAVKGNVVDMAVGVIIGGAFGKIVTSLVGDVIMPVMGKITGNVSFTDLKYELTAAVMDGETVVTPAVYLNYGQFIQNVFDFVIVAFCIFCMVKVLMKLKKKKEEAPAAPPAPSKEEVLLTEIRDILKEKK
ncbi:MAG: large-conductance mechanosensitive channel protein MscL [Muribaculaceae bacterium]|nr:large-conductance mechanosensitive channel protein MscL [Muribaculaceae bacterium]